MLTWFSVALVCVLTGCARNHVQGLLLKDAEVLWHQGKIEERNRVVEEAYQLNRRNPIWNDTHQLAPYLSGSRGEVMNLWAKALASPDESAPLLADARRLSEKLGNQTLIAGTDYRSGYILFDQKQITEAGVKFESVIDRARKIGDSPLLIQALGSLSAVRMRSARYDEAIALCREAAKLLESNPSAISSAGLENNLGSSYLELGDESEALEHLEHSAQLYAHLPAPTDGEVIVLRNIAEYQIRQGKFELAIQKLTEADRAAANLTDDTRAAVLTDLAESHVLNHQLNLAQTAISKARTLAKFSGPIESHEDAHILYVDAMIADQRGDSKAEAGYREVANSSKAWSSMRLEAALKRARWLAAHQRGDEAEDQFRDAETLLEDMRRKLDQDESKLSFFDDAGAMYNEYVDFLISRHKDFEALQTADRSRARLLSDYQRVGLGGLDLARLQSRLKTADAIALSYWIGAEHSYLWIVGAHVFERVTLDATPAAIRAWAQTYFEATSSPAELSPAALDAGKHLRETLLSPAQKYLTHDRRVFLVLDGPLGLLNPESLPGATSRWWIDEAIVSAVPSLALLERTPDSVQPASLLLAMGDADPSPGFPKLPHAALELGAITKLFPSNSTRVYAGSAATPSQYGRAKPDQFQMIHFTAHGKAEAGNPLDSAVVLSRDPGTQANKLYAREIVDIPIHARLVTVSACKSAGSRTYRGEGPVGLAWAFLRAGAGQVVAGLWNVNDEAGEDLMARFYDAMRTRNLPPAAALRDAKRALIKTYKHPYYWAPFEIFAGYVEP